MGLTDKSPICVIVTLLWQSLGVFYLLELNTIRKQNREYEEELMGVYKKRKQAAGARRMSTVLRETQQDREVVLKQVLIALPDEYPISAHSLACKQLLLLP